MSIIIDSGPLVALLSERDQFHAWASEKARSIETPWHTCEAVLSEVFFLLNPFGRVKLCQALRKSELFIVDWSFKNHRHHVLNLLDKYAGTPTSLADVSLISLAEQLTNPIIWTIDKHFEIYRMNGQKKILTIAP